MKKIAIVGAGDLGQQIALHIHQDSDDNVIGYFDDFQNKGIEINKIPVLGKLKDIYNLYEEKMFDQILIGIGYNHLSFRKKVYSDLKGKVPFATFIHSTSIVDPTSEVKEGVIIYPGCIIDQRTVIGENTLINLGCTIAHDSKIGKHSFLSPRVAIAGFVSLGEQSNLGINTTIIDSLTIIDKVKTGGGTVIVKNIIKEGLYVGNPARFIR